MPTRSPDRRWGSLAAFVALSIATLAIGGWLTSAGRGDGWYESLRKPPFQPPDWAFGPAWVTIMSLTALATWRVYEKPGVPPHWRRQALSLYVLQLLFNLTWSYSFFYSHRPGVALAEIALFDLLLALLILAYGRIDRLAALLLVPYQLWLLFATTLNGWIVANN